jgi:hypothetical protein
MAVPGDAAAVVSALRLGWCMAEVRGRNRPDPPPGAGVEPPRPGHALPLQIERTPDELRIEAETLLIVLAAKLGVDDDGKKQPSYARQLNSDAEALYQARKSYAGTALTQWDDLAELIYKFDAHIQDTLDARSETQSCGYQLGRAMAEAYWALDPGAAAKVSLAAPDAPGAAGAAGEANLAAPGAAAEIPNPVAWEYLLSEPRCREIGRLAGRLSRYFHMYTAAAIAGSAMVWMHVAADPRWRENAAPALYQQIRHWFEFTIAAQDPTTLISPYALLRNFRQVAHVLRAFWLQFLLTGLAGAALIVLADLLASPRGTTLAKSLLAAAGVTGFSIAGVSAKLKNQAQALLLRLRQDAYTDLITVEITTAPPQPRVLPGRRRAKLASMARQRSVTPVTPN